MFRKSSIFVLLCLAFLGSACAPATSMPVQPIDQSITSEPTATPTTETLTVPTAQPNISPASVGPSQADFPKGYNPLTGQLMVDPSLADVPAMLVSISHFPATARPQAGISFAPYVFEFSITEGQTRYLAAFYGEIPAPEVPLKGNCILRTGAFEQTDLIIGNQVWLDSNGDGHQSVGERGIGGVCVNLLDESGRQLQATTTDSNGYYGFNVKAGHYIVKVLKPDWLDFTKANVGDEKVDSDTDASTGQMDAEVNSSLLSLDSGLVPSNRVVPTPDPSIEMPAAQVGPVRSGRLLYAHIAAFFQDSCLIYAFASPEVLSQIPKCSFVAHNDSGGGSLLELERFRAIAEENARNTHTDFNYASNLFTTEPSAGGTPATQIDEYWALLNQSGWKYDPLYGAWLRYVDTSEKGQAGILHPEVDRLTGRQLHFENVVIIYADHEVVSPTNMNIHLDQGNVERGLLFRDGRMYPIKWSTKSGAYEKTTGFRRPIQFLNMDGSPAALKPGHTWVIIVTPFSSISETSPGAWKVRFYPPDGSQ